MPGPLARVTPAATTAASINHKERTRSQLSRPLGRLRPPAAAGDCRHHGGHPGLALRRVGERRSPRSDPRRRGDRVWRRLDDRHLHVRFERARRRRLCPRADRAVRSTRVAVSRWLCRPRLPLGRGRDRSSRAWRLLHRCPPLRSPRDLHPRRSRFRSYGVRRARPDGVIRMKSADFMLSRRFEIWRTRNASQRHWTTASRRS